MGADLVPTEFVIHETGKQCGSNLGPVEDMDGGHRAQIDWFY